MDRFSFVLFILLNMCLNCLLGIHSLTVSWSLLSNLVNLVSECFCAQAVMPINIKSDSLINNLLFHEYIPFFSATVMIDFPLFHITSQFNNLHDQNYRRHSPKLYRRRTRYWESNWHYPDARPSLNQITKRDISLANPASAIFFFLSSRDYSTLLLESHR